MRRRRGLERFAQLVFDRLLQPGHRRGFLLLATDDRSLIGEFAYDNGDESHLKAVPW